MGGVCVALAVSGTTPPATMPKVKLPAPSGVSAAVSTQAPVKASVTADAGVADCGCDALPWEDCVHSAKV